MSYRFAVRSCCLLLLIHLPLAAVVAQSQEKKEKPPVPEIVDEPKIIDPATLVAPALAAQATQDFSDSSLREVVAWLQDKQSLVVLLDNSTLAEIGVSPAEPVSDRLSDEPIYLLLNRLRSLGLAWYFEDDVLYITSAEVAEDRLTTLPYSVGDLRDMGYSIDNLVSVIESTVEPESWDSVGGPGALSFLGDVLFVRQTDEVHRQIKGLLAALRNHARQTFVNEPPQHVRLRETLEENVDADFLDTPLQTVIRQLAGQAQIDIRLDLPALRGAVREREPITLKLAGRKLETVLRAMLLDLELTWILRDGVLWITTSDQAEEFLKLAVYDVRDLCRDASESRALIDAIESQADPESWDSVGGPGAIESPKPGVLVINHEERVQMEVLNLLETYRTALRSSKRRERAEEDPNRIITVYYRVHADVARDLSKLLLRFVHPESWKSDARPDAGGEIFVVASEPDLQPVDAASDKKNAVPVVVKRAVLIIRQTRAVHDEIAEVIRRVQSGDAVAAGAGLGGGGLGGGLGGGGLGGGGGGFGGGLLSLPVQPKTKNYP